MDLTDKERRWLPLLGATGKLAMEASSQLIRQTSVVKSAILRLNRLNARFQVSKH